MSNKKAMLIITNVIPAKLEKERSDKKASRMYVGTTFAQALEGPDGKAYANPFRTGFRNIFQRHSADGKSASYKVTPDQLNALKDGKLAIPGEIITKSVEQFPVLGADGKQNKTKDGQLVFASKYSAVVLEDEDVKAVFLAAGHKITGDAVEATSSLSELVA